MSKLPVTAFIITLNEESYLGACIESLAECAEIVIVDSGSTDGTKALAEAYIAGGWPIRFVYEPWRGYAGQKQFALELANSDWCLNIDADERLDDDLRRVLPDLVAVGPDVVGWRIARRPYLIGFGYTPIDVRERKNLRLIRRGAGAYDLSQRVHEGIVARGRVMCSRHGSLLHYRPLLMDEQILKENKYSTLKADQIVDSCRDVRRWKVIVNPPIYFFRLFFLHRLWRCGYPGFIEAMTGAVYSFLTEAKICQRHALNRHSNTVDGTASRSVERAVRQEM